MQWPFIKVGPLSCQDYHTYEDIDYFVHQQRKKLYVSKLISLVIKENPETSFLGWWGL